MKHSAGLEPGKLNPLAAEVMSEVGIDISRNPSQDVFEVYKSGQLFAYVVTVCHESEAGGCPIFLGPNQTPALVIPGSFDRDRHARREA